ncbi:MAG: hypothetical protein FWE11_05600 [Defluviitaleaceae bacterium]|nr:hypothetical protein [Defluviitaleaceae bacterium]
MDKLRGISTTILEIVDNISIVAMIGIGSCAVIYFLFFQWLGYQEAMEFRRHLPALFSVIAFMYGVYRTVPVLEDFWGLTRTRINITHPICVYIGIGLWVLFLNSLIIAFGYDPENIVPFHMILENFFGRYGNDTPHYISIAQRWYENSLCEHRLNIVFFPLYSIFIRVIYFVSPSYMFAAWAVSNFFAVASGVMFYKLVLLLANEKEARLAVKFLYILPSAFFFIVPLTESLFLFLSIGVIYYVLKGKHVHVFAFGLLATLTRSAGALLFIPVACELLRGFNRKDIAKFACLLAFPLGMGIYLLINFMVYGNATQFMVYQYENWDQSLYFFWHTINYLMAHMFEYGRDWAVGLAGPGVIAFGLTLGIIVYGANKIRVSLTMFALGYFIFAFGPTWLLSGPRYAAVLFPLALVGAKIASKKKGYNLVLTIAYLVLFALYFHEFVVDNFVF